MSSPQAAPVVPLTELLAEGSRVLQLAERFRERERALYLVGGTVRDAFLGRSGGDYDFATDAAPDETLEIVKPAAEAVWLQGFRFGTVGARVAGVDVEITTFRTERYEPDSRHPEVAYTREIEIDLSRRDFTVNAMAVRLPEKDAIDPFGGLDDLKAKVIRTPIDPNESFADDPLRMLRAFRFAAQLQFAVAPEVLESVKASKNKLETISRERIRDELSRLLLGRDPAMALRLADTTGITDLFLPELSALKLEQDPVHKHKDVFEHTLAVLERATKVDGDEASLEVRLAALLHDIGKPKTRRIDPEGGVSFHHHEVVGAEMARERLRELRFPNEVVATVEEIIRLHHRFHTYGLGWSDSAVRRYVRDAGPHLQRLNALVRADCTTRNPNKARRLAARMDELEVRIAALAEQEQLHQMRPDLDGAQISAYLGIPPSRTIGEARQFLLDARVDDGPLGEEEAYRRLDGWARARGIDPVGERIPPKEKKADPTDPAG
ncbi:MAG: CCA tRNA nucleotidyltransferase [Actinomycetota bacterium]|nr:CCA tRNA nucleotidyltransferase [Actinomycetota bacterium]